MHLREVTELALVRGGLRDYFDNIHLNGVGMSAQWKSRVAYNYARTGNYILIDNDLEPALEVAKLNKELREPNRVSIVLFENRYPLLTWKALAKIARISIPESITICNNWYEAVDTIDRILSNKP